MKMSELIFASLARDSRSTQEMSGLWRLGLARALCDLGDGWTIRELSCCQRYFLFQFWKEHKRKPG